MSELASARSPQATSCTFQVPGEVDYKDGRRWVSGAEDIQDPVSLTQQSAELNLCCRFLLPALPLMLTTHVPADRVHHSAKSNCQASCELRERGESGSARGKLALAMRAWISA